MIKIDGKEIILGKFPDGTPLLKPDIDFSKYEDGKRATLTWHFESNEEMVHLPLKEIRCQICF